MHKGHTSKRADFTAVKTGFQVTVEEAKLEGTNLRHSTHAVAYRTQRSDPTGIEHISIVFHLITLTRKYCGYLEASPIRSTLSDCASLHPIFAREQQLAGAARQ